MMTGGTKKQKPERPEDVEFAPDAWERFTRTVRRMAETPPKPHKHDREREPSPSHGKRPREP